MLHQDFRYTLSFDVSIEASDVLVFQIEQYHHFLHFEAAMYLSGQRLKVKKSHYIIHNPFPVLMKFLNKFSMKGFD